VEIDENQHRNYAETCECARISEIVGGICGRPVVFIRYNPDTAYFTDTSASFGASSSLSSSSSSATKPTTKKKISVKPEDRLALLVQILRDEIDREHTGFCVEIVQLFYDMTGPKFEPVQRESITARVAC
jgi:hypothetical protein